MTAKNHVALRRALVLQFELEDERREVNRALCGVRSEIKNLLGLALPIGARAQESRRAGKQGGEPKQAKGRHVPMGGTVRAKTAESKRKRGPSPDGLARKADAEKRIRDVAERYTRPVRDAYGKDGAE